MTFKPDTSDLIFFSVFHVQNNNDNDKNKKRFILPSLTFFLPKKKNTQQPKTVSLQVFLFAENSLMT